MKRILYSLIILIVIVGIVGIFCYSVVAQNNKASDSVIGNAKKGKYFLKIFAEVAIYRIHLVKNLHP